MAFYDYYCEANDQTVEVQHPIDEKLTTWGELCKRAGIEPGKTKSTAPVKRLLNGGFLGSNKPKNSWTPALTRNEGHSCGPGCCHH